MYKKTQQKFEVFLFSFRFCTEVMNMKEIIYASLLGFTIGDAMGAPVEFFSKKMIHFRYKEVKEFKSGILGIPYFFRRKGSTTDDTRLLFALAKGSLQTPYSIKGFHKEMNKQRFFPFLIGKNLLYAYLLHMRDWNKTANRVHKITKGKTAGNGALMRTLPIALQYNKWEDVERFTVQQAETTHMHPLSTESCLIYNKIAYYLLQGKDKKEAIEMATKDTRYENVSTEHMKSDGFCVHSLSWTIHWILQTNSFEEAILSAVNEGGDTDTITALVGGLAGILYGLESIPPKWKEGLKPKKKVELYAEKLSSFRNKEKNKQE